MATVVSKRYDAAAAKVEGERQYTVDEAIDLIKQLPGAKFDESVDLSFRLGVDPKHADQMVRGAVVLPHGRGRTVRVAVFAKGEKEREAREAGADVVGAEDLVERVQGGWMEFDTTIATPDLMGQVGRLGKVLGPRGLMPNPKLGTVTFDVARAVREAKAGKVEYRVDKAGNVHVSVGKRSFGARAARGQRHDRHRVDHARQAVGLEGDVPPIADRLHHDGPGSQRGRPAHLQSVQEVGLGEERNRADAREGHDGRGSQDAAPRSQLGVPDRVPRPHRAAAVGAAPAAPGRVGRVQGGEEPAGADRRVVVGSGRDGAPSHRPHGIHHRPRRAGGGGQEPSRPSRAPSRPSP